MPTKQSLRRELQTRLQNQLPAQRARRSQAIEAKLFGLEAFKRAGCVCFYVSLPLEVDTAPMIDRALREGKRVLVPRTDLENKELSLHEIKDRLADLQAGTMGIMEPMPQRTRCAKPGEAQCVIVPGLGFDHRQNRLGRGAGFYDRFLKRLAPGTVTVGLAFSFQVLPELPVEAHDVPLNCVLTD